MRCTPLLIATRTIFVKSRQQNNVHHNIADVLTEDIAGTRGYYRGLDKGEGELGCD